MISPSTFGSLCEAWASHGCGAGQWSGGLRWRAARRGDGSLPVALCSPAVGWTPAAPPPDISDSLEEEASLGLCVDTEPPLPGVQWVGSITIALHPAYQVPNVYIRLSNEKGEPATNATLRAIISDIRAAAQQKASPPSLSEEDEWIEEDSPLPDGLPALGLQHCCDVSRLMALLDGGEADPLYLLKWFCAVGHQFGVQISPIEYQNISNILKPTPIT